MRPEIAMATIEGRLVKDTAKAILFRDDDSGEEVWLPKSQIDLAVIEDKVTAHVSVTAPEWLLIDKGLL